MNRRDFLRGLVLSASAASAGLILPTSAQALVMGDRYHRLVTSLRDLLDSHSIREAIYAPIGSWAVMGDDGRMISTADRVREQREAAWQTEVPRYRERFEALFYVMGHDFSDMTAMTHDPIGVQRKVNRIMHNAEIIDILDEDSLRQHEDAIVCIAVMRSLLTQSKVSVRDINLTASPYWRTFMDRYSKVIMNSQHPDRDEQDDLWVAEMTQRAQKRGLIPVPKVVLS